MVHPWAFPEQPWQRLHLDFLEPVYNRIWLVIVDAHSKWPEMISFSSMPSSKVLTNTLRNIFARFGLPLEIVTDNAAQFTSQEFKQFYYYRGILHRLSAPYHPATNGDAERFVRTFKEAMKSFENQNDWLTNALRFLLSYRTTPRATLGVHRQNYCWVVLYARAGIY